MKEKKQNLNKHEFDLTNKLNRNLETGSCLQKNTEIKNNFINFMYVDCLDACFG
jgi:hypothetical protein